MLLYSYADGAVDQESASPIYYRLVNAVKEHFFTQHAVVDRVECLCEVEEDQVGSCAGVHYTHNFLLREEKGCEAGPSGDEAMLTQRGRGLKMV